MEQIFNIDKSIEHLKKYFSIIESKFDGYEERKSQKVMIMNILKAYESGKHTMVEAPTGTGKSMAYILAFLSLWEQFPLNAKPKLVVSTRTIPLQEQLIHKDVPYFRDILNLNFSAVLVKGRSNYICTRKIDDIISKRSNEGFFDTVEEVREFNSLKELILDSKNRLKVGDRGEIEATVSNSLWGKLCSEADNCMKKKCVHYDDCFFYKAREKQKAADILIANHSLFFADLKVKMETGFEIEDLVLPQFDYIVFDEAHHIEDVATDFMGLKISRFRYRRLISNIKKSILNGELSSYFNEEEDTKNEVRNLCSTLEFMSDNLFMKIVEILGNNSTKRLMNKDIGFASINSIKKSFEQLKSIIKTNYNKSSYTDKEELIAKSLIARIETLVRDTEDIINQNLKEYAYWIECPSNRDTRHYFASLNCCPISISELLKDNLFERNKSIVLTSATMGTNNMGYIASRIGINEYIPMMLKSPFDYEKQSRIYVPEKALNPKEGKYETYLEEEIKRIIRSTNGRALVLFTSYRLMNSLGDKLKPLFEELNLNFLKQGELPRTMLLDIFRKDTNSVLFATASYWEGIDVKGDSLSCVIITKLPFEVPDKPIIEARMEKLTKEGKNPFAHYQVPMAVMRFKQGFGRLIRSSSDKGVVAVLDNRLISMNYGQQFIKSLPLVPLTRNVEDIENILS